MPREDWNRGERAFLDAYWQLIEAGRLREDSTTYRRVLLEWRAAGSPVPAVNFIINGIEEKATCNEN